MTTKSNAGQAGTTDTKSTIESTFKDSKKLSDSQLIEDRDKIIEKRKLIFDRVVFIGLAVLIIYFIWSGDGSKI